MSPETIEILSSIAASLEKLSLVNQQEPVLHLWDTQWLSSLAGAIVGAMTALTVGIARDYFSLRRKNLENWYSHIIERQQPTHIFEMAFITSYGHTRTENGRTEVIPEKSLPEKILIEFRKNYKYWNLPLSRLRFLFWRYERALHKIPHLNRQQLEESIEYLKARDIFSKIIKLSEKKTGENQWTIREPH